MAGFSACDVATNPSACCAPLTSLGPECISTVYAATAADPDALQTL